MTAPALRIIPSMDDVRDRVEDVRDRVTALQQTALPRFEEVRRQADITVDRLRGRPVRPFWFKPLIVIGAAGLLAALVAMVTSWSRNRASRLMDDDALDHLDRMSEPPASGLEARSVDAVDDVAGFGTATTIETRAIGLDGQQADIN